MKYAKIVNDKAFVVKCNTIAELKNALYKGYTMRVVGEYEPKLYINLQLCT